MKRGIHAVAWVLLAVAAFVLWPQRWGGSMTYVITSGVSMQPSFRQGDLAVLRSSDDYQIGDVAAYDSRELKKIVMHRITKETDKGYAFQGDNNDFVDPETVSREQLLGKLVLRVPAAGKWLTWFVQPVNLLIAGAAMFLLLGDRKRDQSPARGSRAPLGRVRVSSLDLRSTAVTAVVVDAADLERLAAHYDRPVLEADGDTRRYVVDGDVVYTWSKAATPAAQRRRTPQGRDWAYDGPHLQSIPHPRGAEQQQIS